MAYGWIARSPPLSLSKSLFSAVHLGSRRIRQASVWLRSAIFGGGLHLDVLFATQLVGVLSRIQNMRELTWSESLGSPSGSLNSWLVAHDWEKLAPWKWRHVVSNGLLDFTVVCPAGERQHVVRQAWRAWCCKNHCESNRRDADLDCFNHGLFSRINWHGIRVFAASSAEARAIATGSTMSPAALLSAKNESVEDSCLWPGCHEIGAFDHVCWACACRPPEFDIPPRPGEFVTARFGWLVDGSHAVIKDVHDWLVFVQRRIWEVRHGD